MIEMKPPTTRRGVIRETGNGLPDEGDIVMASEGTLYRIGRSLGPIETHEPGHGDTERVELEDIGRAVDDPELCCNNPRHGDECTCLIRNAGVEIDNDF